MIQVTLKRGRSKPFWLGHPWVFSGAIQKVSGKVGDLGGSCVVIDERDNIVGSGFYNPNAKIAVRMLEHRRTTDREYVPKDAAEIVPKRLEAAAARRRALGLPTKADTTVYRLVHGEGDMLPGLVIDRLGDVAHVQLNSRGMYVLRDSLAGWIKQAFGLSRVILSVTETASRLEAIPVMTEVVEGEGGSAHFRENGIAYDLDLTKGQKTGFYADQRENRARFAALSVGKTVLDAYSYIGGFGLNALKAGAAAVTSVDTSKPAVEAALRTSRANNLALTGVNEDAVTFMKEAHARGTRFDRIVVDPPKFARGRSHLDDALKKYAKVNSLAMALLAPDGLLLSCSCSQHVSERDFGRMLTESAHRHRRAALIHETWSQPGDHPFLSVAPEGQYLKAFLASVH